jgi:hypothetical protein
MVRILSRHLSWKRRNTRTTITHNLLICLTSCRTRNDPAKNRECEAGPEPCRRPSWLPRPRRSWKRCNTAEPAGPPAGGRASAGGGDRSLAPKAVDDPPRPAGRKLCRIALVQQFMRLPDCPPRPGGLRAARAPRPGAACRDYCRLQPRPRSDDRALPRRRGQ